MGGPGVGLLVEHALTEDQWDEVDQWIRSIASGEVSYKTGSWHWGEERAWHFDMSDGTRIGLPSLESQEAFHVGLSVGKEPSPEQWEQLSYDPARMEEYGFERADLEALLIQNQQARAVLGYLPEQEIGLYVIGPYPDEYRVLGHLALRLSERYHALIDLGGRLYWRPPNKRWEEVTEEDMDQYAQRLALSGRLLRLFGSTVVDAEWLRAWLQHPDFHLIK